MSPKFDLDNFLYKANNTKNVWKKKNYFKC